MGDFDDMNATPLGKLPMPAVHSKQDEPRVDMGPSYSDILKEMQRDRQPAVAPAAPQPAAGGPQAQGVPQFAAPHQYQQYQQHQQHQQHAMVPPSPPSYAQEPQEDYYSPPPHRPAVPRKRGRAERRRRGPDPDDDDVGPGPGPRMCRGGLLGRLREYKSSLLVTAIVFLVLWYAAPKLAAAAPQLLTPTGRFNVAGLLVIAGTAGGIHRAADHYLG